MNHMAKQHSKNIKIEENTAAFECKDEVIEEKEKRATEIGIEHVEVPSVGMTCPLVKEEMEEMEEELEDGEVRMDKAEKQEVVKLMAISENPLMGLGEDPLMVIVMGEIRIKKEEEMVIPVEREEGKANLFGFDEYLDDDKDLVVKAECV